MAESPFRRIEWFYLPFFPIKFGDLEVKVEDKIAKLNDWIDNDRENITALLSQYRFATGKVLVGGLGLGMLPLLIASKTEVTEVIVVEKDIDVIKCFQHQKFNQPKLKIINKDIFNTDESSFDWVMLDHYNYPVTDDDLDAMVKIAEKHNCQGKLIFYLWEKIYFEKCRKEKIKKFDLKHLHNFCEKYSLPKFSESDARLYLFDRQKQDFTPEDVVKALKTIEENRHACA